ncbi:hypothetical protein AJ80_09761 [Polytolypa hystricis UAMH7299]|uniref:F-box domain-containing protein n=1 Tax=Polytolypa hystricis (strain UAMH7299) TaxID=1447883 RepID=A0A2B7WJT5_POLH7|nr:hypothetical protein AJ80_09761 [Polytolypa hystricis UAMH7299]
MLKVDAPQERMKEERLSAAAALVQWLPHLSSLRLLNLDSTLSEEMLSTFDFSRFEALTTLKVPAELLVKFDTETQWPLAERLPSQLTELHVEEWWPLVESRDILPSMLLEYLRAKPAALRLISVVSDADYWTPREKVLQEQCDKRAVAFNLNFICAKYGEDRHEQ